MSEDVEKRCTWRAVGLNGHREVFGSEFLYTSEDAPVEADEYVRAMERADRLLVERDAAIKRAEAAEADAKAQRNAKDIAIARNGELHQELHAMRQRAEAAEVLDRSVPEAEIEAILLALDETDDPALAAMCTKVNAWLTWRVEQGLRLAESSRQ